MEAVSYLHLRHGQPLPALSLPPFTAIIVAEDKARNEWREEVSGWLVRSGCLYCVSWGNACEAWHDSVDHANISAFEGDLIPDDRLVMTTWHENEPLSEAMWFAAGAAAHPTIELKHALIVHVALNERRNELLKQYQTAADK